MNTMQKKEYVKNWLKMTRELEEYQTMLKDARKALHYARQTVTVKGVYENA